MIKALRREDFKYVVTLPCPVKAPLKVVRDWMADTGIKFLVEVRDGPSGFAVAHFKMLEESDATMFKLRWA